MSHMGTVRVPALTQGVSVMLSALSAIGFVLFVLILLFMWASPWIVAITVLVIAWAISISRIGRRNR